MARTRSDVPARGGEASAVAIRVARPSDRQRLRRLAALDSQPAPHDREPMLLAEVGGELRAAVSLDGSRRLADPFRHSAWLITLLELRAAQLGRSGPSLTPRRRRRQLVSRSSLAA